MYRTLVYGAGSIGNHLGHACRNKGWAVTMFDSDPEALSRTRADIYPSRYGKWDDEIELSNELDRNDQWDLVIIGTPPDSHLPICLGLLEHCTPRVILIEKPMCTPDLAGCRELVERTRELGVTTLVGYNHNLTRNTARARQLLCGGLLGDPRSMSVRWVEHWGGIFNAHPWLDGPADSYLGFTGRGGGACAEHSHAISLYLYFSQLLGMGAVSEVSAMMDICRSGGVEYDRSTFITLRTDHGFVGAIAQDVVTEPPRKVLRVQGTEGFLEWHANYDPDHDAVIYKTRDSEVAVEKFAKSRPDDFAGEIDHVEELLNGDLSESPISLAGGVEAMMVVAASHLSNRDQKVVRVDTGKVSDTLERLANSWKKEDG